jgi:hypothetical protein
MRRNMFLLIPLLGLEGADQRRTARQGVKEAQHNGLYRLSYAHAWVFPP